MSWDGGGTFDRVHNFSADASAGIQAQAARFDAEFDEYKTGLENCLTVTGETTPTANQPMGGFRHTGVAAAVSADNYTTVVDQANQVAIYVRDTNTTATGAMSASATMFPTSFSDGQRLTVLVSAAGSTSATRTIVVNGLSANIYDADGSAVPAANMVSGGVYDLVYDASAGGFKLLNNAALTATNVNTAISSAGSFVPTFGGFGASAPASSNVKYTVNGNLVTMAFAFGLGESSSSACYISNVPSTIRSNKFQTVPITGLVDNGGAASWGSVYVSGINLHFQYEGAINNFTASGSKGLDQGVTGGAHTITYSIDPNFTE